MVGGLRQLPTFTLFWLWFVTAHVDFVKLITSLLCSSKNVAHTNEQFVFMIIILGKQAKLEGRISLR